MAADPRAASQRRRGVEVTARERARGDEAGHGGGRARAKPALERDRIRHLDPPPDLIEPADPELGKPGLERDDEPVRPVLGQLADTVALDRQVDLGPIIEGSRLDGDPQRQVDREPQAVVAGTEVCDRRGRFDRDGSADK